MQDLPPVFPQGISEQDRAAVLRDYSARVLNSLVMLAAQKSGCDPIELRAQIMATSEASQIYTLAEMHCRMSWLDERVEALEAEARAQKRGGSKWQR